MGGGKAVIPEGTWLTGAVHLKDNIELHLEDGAVLLFTEDKTEYLPVVFTGFEGCHVSDISLKNVAMKNAKNGIVCEYADNITMENVSVS